MKNRFFPLLKKELFSLLLSPALYIALLVFVVGAAVNYFIVEQFFIIQTGSSDLRFFFSIMPYMSILVIPSLTMNLWATEGDFIDSTPFNSFELILTKWIATSVFFLIALILCIPIPLFVSFFADIDHSQLFAGFFVMFLCGICYVALSQCISLLFKNPIASFISSALLLFFVNSIHLIPLYISLPLPLSSIIQHISFSWHFDAAGKGILDSSDILFYLIFTFFFIILATFIRESRKGKKYSPFMLSQILIGVALLLINTSLFTIRIDLTESKLFSVSKVSEEIIDSINQPLQIRYYVSPELTQLYPQVRDVKEYLRAYSSKTKHIGLEIIDPEKEGSTELLDSLGLKSQQIQTSKGSTTSFVTVYSSIVLEYLNKFEVIPFLLSASSLEFDLTNRINQLLTTVKPSVYLYFGKNLSLESDYSYVVPWLEASGYSVILCNTDVSNLTDLKSPLIVFGSQVEDEQLISIESFIMKGGRALFCVSGNDTAIYSDWYSMPIENNNLLSMLSYWGFSIEEGLLMDIANYRITMQSSDGLSWDYINYPLWVSILPQYTYQHPITQGFSGLELYWASPMTIFSTEHSLVTPIITSSPLSFIQKPIDDSSSFYVTDPYTLKKMSFSSEETYTQPVVAILEGSVSGYFSPNRSEKTAIIVIPDQWVFSNLVEYTNSAYNLDILVNSVLYLSHEEALLSIKNKENTLTSLYKITDNVIFNRLKNIAYIITLGLIPLCILLIPIAVFFYRRKKNAQTE